MVVRGLGCPVRFTLTAGQKGDAPQAAALIEGLAAEVVMADTAYDADHLRQAIAAKGAIAVIPNNPSRALKYPLDKDLYAQRHLVECYFVSSSRRPRRVKLLPTSSIAPHLLFLCLCPRPFLRPGLQLRGASRAGARPGWPSRWRCRSLRRCQATP
jgi:transposase